MFDHFKKVFWTSMATFITMCIVIRLGSDTHDYVYLTAALSFVFAFISLIAMIWTHPKKTNVQDFEYFSRGAFEAWLDENRHDAYFAYALYKGRWVAVDVTFYPSKRMGRAYTYTFYAQYSNALMSECITKIAVPKLPELGGVKTTTPKYS